MKIFVAHATALPWKQDFYAAIRNSELNKQYEFYLPQETPYDKQPPASSDFIKTFDLLIAECSYPSIGMGMELGWANLLQVPIVCIFKKGSSVTGSIKFITHSIIEYENEEDMLKKLEESLSTFTPSSR